MTFVAASHGKSFVVVFCWAWPRLSCCFAALETKRKSGWGICGSSWVVLLWFCLMICLFHRYRPIVLCTAFFTAYVVIRTVPQSINGQTRGKKKNNLTVVGQAPHGRVQQIINLPHPTVWGLANYCEVVKRSKRVKRYLYHIHAHYSQWCKVTALLTPAQATRHG